MNNASRDQVKTVLKITDILARLMKIKEGQSEVVKELNEYLKYRVDGAMWHLSDYLSSEEVIDRFTSWTLDEVPRVESSWEVTENEITKVLSRRLREIIEQWEEDNQLFTSARESLVKHFQQRYQFVEGQLHNLQTAVTSDHVNVLHDIGVTSPIWSLLYSLGLGVVPLVTGAPVVAFKGMKEKMEDKKKIKKYEANKCAYMAKLSAEYLLEAKNEISLQTFVREPELEDVKLCLKQIAVRFADLIQADKMFYEQLIDETRSQKEIEETYQPIMNEGSKLRGHLAVFGFTEVCANEINSDELDWKEDVFHRLGHGAFGAVYKGTMRRREAFPPVPVALKVCDQALDATNASETMAEVELLR